MKLRYLTLSLATLTVLVVVLWRMRQYQVSTQTSQNDKYEYAGSIDFREGAEADAGFEISGKLDLRTFVPRQDSVSRDSVNPSSL
ncbi:MAG: hypothetical protein AAFR59_12995 [Bacteroidota bacterium]